MSEVKDYYLALELGPGASREMIAEAYERLARRYQPDPDKPPVDPEKMAAINEAFDVLDDPVRRAEYDRMRSSAGAPVPPEPEGAVRDPEAGHGYRATAGSTAMALLLIGGGVLALVVAAGLLVFALVRGDDGGESRLTGVEVVLPSGLGYTDIVIGDGDQPRIGDSVLVHYTGWLEDGTRFDSSLDRQRPFDFIIGAGQVIAGWDEGLLTMREGGKRKLVIPPDLGYGSTGNGPIPPNSTLIFEIELLEIQ